MPQRAQGSLQGALGAVVVMFLQLVLVAQDLAVELVGEFIDGRVEVGMSAFGKDVLALDVDVARSSLTTKEKS